MNMTIAGEKVSMDPLYYFAAWTDSGCLLGCSHAHASPSEAVACIDCAGGYVVAVEKGVSRALTPDEEAEFQAATDATRRDKQATVEIDLPTPADYAPKRQLQRLRGERLLDFVPRFIDHYGFGQPAAPSGASWDSNAAPARLQHHNDDSARVFDMQRESLVVLIGFIDLVLDWLNSWQVSELERMHAKQVPVWLETLRDRARRALEREVVD